MDVRGDLSVDQQGTIVVRDGIGRLTPALAKVLFGRHGFVIQRPVYPDRAETFPLAVMRTGPPSDLPVLFIPGGPGMGSVLPYVGLRATATQHGLDAIMVEHRGVGLSRRDNRGRDLPLDAVTLEAAADDLAAVVQECGVKSVVAYGSSYGSHQAQVFAARHPELVAAMVLDSPLLSVEDDLAMVRAHRRRLLWDGDDPALIAVASAVQDLAATGISMAELSHAVEVVYEFAGPQVLLRLLRARRAGRQKQLWRQVSRLGVRQLEGRGVSGVMEPDLVAGIAYGQLGFGLPVDGEPLDPQLHFAEAAVRQPAFHGQPLDLPTQLAAFNRPLVVVSGDRDLRTPRPIAERAVSLAPDAVLVPLVNMGHSALDAHQSAAVHIAHALTVGAAHGLPAEAGRLSGLRRRGASHWLGHALNVATRLP
ncbi:alpha/beta hydrolase [Kineosporia rhizophila]|uniref:alpha/beta fold hydrolase n=1 Tax=Kineosporia rhizophila TaxID=84633 RepID=UPI001E50D63B|nr:alpha/beta hydrolase [Kineosporia rhizophila]